MATISQIRQIHTLKSRLGLDDDTYRDMLWSFSVITSKDLTDTEAAVLIDVLAYKAVARGIWKHGPKAKKYEDCDYRDSDYASSSQLRMIEVLWNKTSYAGYKNQSLRKFLQNKFKISDIRFLTKSKASKVIQALQIINQNNAKALSST